MVRLYVWSPLIICIYQACLHKTADLYYFVNKPQNHELPKSKDCHNVSIQRNSFSYFVKTHFHKKCSDLIASHCTMHGEFFSTKKGIANPPPSNWKKRDVRMETSNFSTQPTILIWTDYLINHYYSYPRNFILNFKFWIPGIDQVSRLW